MLGRLVLAEREPVADDRPRRFLRDRRLDPVLLEQAELVAMTIDEQSVRR